MWGKLKDSVRRLPSGRFKVSFPFKSDPNLLGSSFDTAKRRFLALERKLSKDKIMREIYNDFMKEYVDLGHMSITDNCIPNFPHYFILHQWVLRKQKKKCIAILWRPNPSDSLQVYRLNTVTYGTSSAPFLAISSSIQ